MDRPDPIRSAAGGVDVSWLEDLSDQVLDDPDAKESFLREVLSPAAKSSWDFRNRLRGRVSSHRDRVAREISERLALGYLVPWPPGAAIRLGDVGVFPSGALFVVETQLPALGVDLPTLDEGPTHDIQYASSGVTVQVTDGGGRRIEFDAPDSTYFRATGCQRRRIDGSALASGLMRLQEPWSWNEDWAVVCEVVEANELVLLVSANANGFVELAGGFSNSGRGAAPLGRAVVTATARMRLTVLAGPDVVALYKVAKIRRSLWSSRDAAPELAVPSSYDEL